MGLDWVWVGVGFGLGSGLGLGWVWVGLHLDSFCDIIITVQAIKTGRLAFRPKSSARRFL